MFRLTSKLAVSNLIKNRTLYYPFALATCVAVAITYIFISLTFNPHLSKMAGSSTIAVVLALGMVIVTIAATIIVLYANSFVMKNRSKELGVYGMLGLNKRHLFSMIFIELVLFGLVTVALGLGAGILFDNLIYAFLLKLIGVKAVLVSTFQVPVVIAVVFIYGGIFALLVFVNGWRLLRFNALQMTKEKQSGEKKGRFLVGQTILGILALAAGYYLALSVTNPMSAIFIFFLAVLLVILATYLLFNAGITVFLQMLQKNKNYYYQPKNMISVSNLIYRMKKNAVGLATICILSTMVLVTLAGGSNIYAGDEYFQKAINPSDFALNGKNVTTEQMNQVFSEFVAEQGLKVKKQYAVQSYIMGVKEQTGNTFELYNMGQNRVIPKSIIFMMSTKDYETMTGQKLDLQENEAAIYSKNVKLDTQQKVRIANQDLTVKKEFNENFIFGYIPDEYSLITDKILYMVVNHPDQLLALQSQQFNVTPYLYGGLNIEASNKVKEKLNQPYQKKLEQFNQTLPEGTAFYGSARVVAVKEFSTVFGGLFFIGIFLAIVFMLGTVLVIYYKQVSEGYEDRERFVILQKVGLDQEQTNQTIRRQVLTVFFLPLIFAFVHLAFAYHMLSLILKILGVLNSGLMLMVTLGVCAIFLIVYIVVFLITSRSYHRIVKM
ncbi:ABC transporter permease [Streptococcus massiliensis]|uniref:Putative ABC transporter permease n=1 Tax=Streptococcus massiliensis TaxID=313439 RepID=A0A380KZK1_9STRE|nr:ABC transporter permease [Streptococcus massiliensis]SUN77424.1 putative ABC transporter permease [Streptococcus massiliensis]